LPGEIDQDLRTEVGKDLIETRSKLSELAERKTAAVDQLNRIDIRAPQSGRVYELSVHTVGGVISPGEQVMLIVPDADSLAIVLRISPRDIDQVFVRTYLKIAGTGSVGKRAGRNRGSSVDRTPSEPAGAGATGSRRRSVRRASADYNGGACA
jgi:hypothetical protein